MKNKIQKVTVFRADGKDFESEAEANKYLQDKEKDEIYTRVFDRARAPEYVQELLDFIGNLSNKELSIIRQMTHKK